MWFSMTGHACMERTDQEVNAPITPLGIAESWLDTLASGFTAFAVESRMSLIFSHQHSTSRGGQMRTSTAPAYVP